MRANYIGIMLLVAGIIAFGLLRVINDPGDWVLAQFEMPLAKEQSRDQLFSTPADGYLEFQIAVDSNVDRELSQRYILATDLPSELQIRWEVHSDGMLIAAGDAKDYLYVVGTPSLLGRIRRNVMHVPFGGDAAHWNSVGLLGNRSLARGIGRFRARANGEYSVRVTSHAEHSKLDAFSPRFLVGVDRKRWAAHYNQTRIIGYLGLIFLVCGFTMLLFARLRRHQSTPVR